MMVPPSAAQGTSSMTLTWVVLSLLLLFLGVILGVAKAGGTRQRRRRDDYHWRHQIKIWRSRPTGMDWLLWHDEMDGHWAHKDMDDAP